MAIDLDTQLDTEAKICIIGVGGAGGNAVNNMITRGVKGVSFITANTDKQALDKTLAEHKILLGANTTRGLGAGARPEVGKQAAEESAEEIKEALTGYDLIFVTCGMGGGTGTGGSPVVAGIAKKTGALVVAIVSKCFTREGANKTALAEEGISKLSENVDAYIVVPNDKISQVCPRMRPSEAYHKANDILHNSTSGIVDIITNNGYINVDFADVRTALTGVGEVLIGTGVGRGENAAAEAVTQALNSPFFDNLSIRGSKFALMNIKHGLDYTTDDIDLAYTTLRAAAVESIDVKEGLAEVESDDFTVTILAAATKVDPIEEKKKQQAAATANKSNGNNSTSNNAPTVIISPKAPKTKYNTNLNNSINLFSIYENEQNIKSASELIGSSSRITNAAATVKQPNKPSIEILPEHGYGNRFGRPHGEDELKMYDQPANLRRKAKYTLIDNTSIVENAMSNSDSTLPQAEEKPKLQDIVDGITAASGGSTAMSNPFFRRLADTGIKKTD